MNFLSKEKYHIPILILVCIILLFWKISSIPLTDGDSAFYAKIAKNIVDTGDWMTMHYGDPGTIIDKPPLMMWLTAASFKLFGFNDFAASFWHSIFALLIVVFTYQLAKEIFDKRTAFISSLILISSSQFFYQSRSPLQDIPLTLFILLSVYTFLLFEKSGRLSYFYLSPVFIALAVLTKGPVGIALPAVILIVYIFMNKTKLPGIWHIISAILLFIAIALPWFAAEYRILGKDFLDVFMGHNFGRYLGPIDTIGSEATKYSAIRPQYDFYSYFLQLLILFIPWSGFIYPAFYYSYKKRTNILPAIFALSVVLFFSLSLNYKISRYILPAFPAIAMMIGKMMTDLMEKGNKEAKQMSFISAIATLIVVTVPLFVIVFSLFYIQFTDVSAYYLPVIITFLLPMTLALVAGSVLIFFKKYRLSFIAALLLTFIAYLFFIFNLSVFYPGINPISRFCGQINAMVRPSDIVCQYKGTDAHFMIYYSKNNVTFIRSEAEMAKLLLSEKKVYCVTENEKAYEALKALLKERIVLLNKSNNYSLFSN